MSDSGCLLYPLKSLLRPLDFGEVFGRCGEVEVELGCGDGSFLLRYAALNPGRNYLGIERLLGRISKIDRKGRRLGLVNLRGLRVEARYCLDYLLPRGGVSALHVYFPDPWPKAKHARRRLVDATFPASVVRVLSLGGRVYLRTDDEAYWEQMGEAFAVEKRLRQVETPEELAGVTTDFEEEFLAQGKPARRWAFELC
ncbi:MAG: tRNA (guanosine(46)-N7)-methyltransferase TrmB [Limisphaerales bacterium]